MLVWLDIYQGTQPLANGGGHKLQVILLIASHVGWSCSKTTVSAFHLTSYDFMWQHKYTQAERGHAAFDEELTRGYIHNLEVHASQQERVGHYSKNEPAKQVKVSDARVSHSKGPVGGAESAFGSL